MEGNLILNTLDRLLSTRPNPTAQNSNFRVGIRLTSTPINAGGLAAAPRQHDTATGTIIAPYSYNYTDSGELNDQPVGLNHNIVVRGNIVKRTLPAVTNYSDWGFGKMFSRFQNTGIGSPPPNYIVDGEADPEIENANLRVRSLEIRDGIQDSLIDSNTFEGSGIAAVRFIAEQTTASDNDISNLTFKDNVIRDFRSTGVDLATDYTGTTQSITFEGNTIDGDPFFQDTSGRRQVSSKYDGSWVASGACTGLSLSLVSGCNILRNHFKNVSNPYLLGSGQLTSGVREGNLLYGEPANGIASNVFSQANKGIGQYPTDMQWENSLVRVKSDPTSADYGKPLVNGAKTTSGSSVPTEGYFFVGTTIPVRRATTVNSATVFAFRRLTNSDNHVAGVDWEQLTAGATTTGGSSWVPTGNVINASSESTAIVGGAYLSGGFIYLLSNAASNERVFRYTNYVHDGTDFSISGAGLFVRDLNYNYANNNRLVTGSGGSAYEYDATWTATGNSLTGAGAGVAQIGSFFYAISTSGLVTEFNSSFVATGTTFNTNIYNVVGIAQGAGPSPDLYIVDSSGIVYTSSTDGVTVSTLFDSGLTATGISVDRANTGNVLITTATGATEFAEN